MDNSCVAAHGPGLQLNLLQLQLMAQNCNPWEGVLVERHLPAFRKPRRLPTSAVRALLQAQRLLGLAFGLEIAERRSDEEPLQRTFGQAKLNEVLLRAFREVADILGEHLDKVHESSRPRITRRSFGTASCGSEG